MGNSITEIYDKQAVVDNLNQLGELINSSLNAIVASAPKLQSPIEYLTAVQSISEIEKKNTEVTQAKAKALSDLDKAYQQADKAIQQSINLDDAEFQAQTKLTSQYKEKAKEQKQLLELERTRQQTMQNSTKLLQMEAKSEGELRMQQQQLIKAQQSLRVTNAEENALREKLIAKINANKEALRGMSDEVSKQRDNVGNYKSVWDAFTEGQVNLKQAMKLVRDEMSILEGQMAAGNKLTAEQQKRYNDLNIAMGNLTDIQGDMSARAKILADDYRNMTFTMEGMKLGVNIMTSLQATTALLGNENEELAKTMAKIVAIQQVMNTLSEVQKALNKDNSIMQNLQIIATRDLTNATMGQVTATKLAGVAYKALNGIMKAGLGVVGIFGAAIAGAVKMIKDLFSNTEKAREEQEKQNQILKDAQDETLQYNNRLQQLNVELTHYRDVLNEIADAYTTAGQKANIFQKQSVTQLAFNALLKEYNKYLEEYAALALEISQHPGPYKDRERDEKRLGYLYGMVKDLGEEAAAVGRNVGGAMSDSEKKISRFQDLMSAVADVVEKVNAKSKELAETTKNQTENTEKERESKEEELSVEEKLYLLRKKINEEREKQELPALGKVTVKVKKLADETEILTNRMQSALLAISYEYTKALNDAITAEEKSRIEKEKTRKELEMQIEYTKRLLETLQPQTDEWYRAATALEQYKAKMHELNQMEPEWLTKLKSEVEEAGKAIQSLSDMNNVFAQDDLDRLTAEKDAYTLNYEARKQTIENTILDEEKKQNALRRLNNDKLIHDREFARQEAEIKRRQAIFQNAVDAAAAMSKAIAAVGELMSASAFSLPTFITAVATGVSAIATISSLIKKMIEIPAYATGGTAEANKPFIAGEKGREIGFGVYSGKVYDFSKPTLFKANEPINIKNASETRQIINNNEYNKDVTLHNEISVQVIDNTRINKFFKIW